MAQDNPLDQLWNGILHWIRDHFGLAGLLVVVAFIVAFYVWTHWDDFKGLPALLRAIHARWDALFGIEATVYATVDEQLQHVPWVTIEIRNRGFRTVVIDAIEFTTKAQWDMPDRYVRAQVTSVMHFMREFSCIKISPDTCAVASKAIRQEIPRKGFAAISFRLVTDHAPAYPFGLFLYHLGVTLVYNSNRRRPLNDLLVSIHGNTDLAHSTYDGPVDPFAKLGDNEHFANAALSILTKDVVCPPEVRRAIENLVR